MIENKKGEINKKGILFFPLVCIAIIFIKWRFFLPLFSVFAIYILLLSERIPQDALFIRYAVYVLFGLMMYSVMYSIESIYFYNVEHMKKEKEKRVS